MKQKTPKRTRQLRCFVAMRIGDRLADAVYDRLIAPTIRRVGLAPRRIDRLLHNERIDQKILAELDTADLVLADLTFARPSVYWEAGYAEGRRVPVVYSCQKNHFQPRRDDKFGNFKVHFDLQTKNIIPWTDATDHRFRTALEGRLPYVLRPVLKARSEAEAQKRWEDDFAALSMTERRQRVVDLAIRQAHRIGFRGRRQDADIDDARFAPRWFAVAQYAARLTRDGSHGAHTALVVAVPKLTKSALRAIRDQLTSRPLDEERARDAAAKCQVIVDHGIVVSFAPVLPGMVAEILATFRRDDLTAPWPRWSAVEHDVSGYGVRRRNVNVHVLAGIRSEPQARDGLKRTLALIGARGRNRRGQATRISPRRG